MKQHEGGGGRRKIRLVASKQTSLSTAQILTWHTWTIFCGKKHFPLILTALFYRKSWIFESKLSPLVCKIISVRNVLKFSLDVQIHNQVSLTKSVFERWSVAASVNFLGLKVFTDRILLIMCSVLFKYST